MGKKLKPLLARRNQQGNSVVRLCLAHCLGLSPLSHLHTLTSNPGMLFILSKLEPKWIRIVIYTYIYIYILGSHMAPYGACEVAQSTARSKAQFEAEGFRKELRRKKTHCRKCFRRKKKHARKCFRRTKEACSSSDFERPVGSRHARAVISSAQWLRSTLEQ